jgi:hypothetical protein
MALIFFGIELNIYSARVARRIKAVLRHVPGMMWLLRDADVRARLDHWACLLATAVDGLISTTACFIRGWSL